LSWRRLSLSKITSTRWATVRGFDCSTGRREQTGYKIFDRYKQDGAYAPPKGLSPGRMQSRGGSGAYGEKTNRVFMVWEAMLAAVFGESVK